MTKCDRDVRSNSDLFSEFRNPMGQAGYFPPGGITMNDALLTSADDGRFGFRHGGEGIGAIACRYGFLDFAQCAANPRPAHLIDCGAALDLTSGFFG